MGGCVPTGTPSVGNGNTDEWWSRDGCLTWYSNKDEPSLVCRDLALLLWTGPAIMGLGMGYHSSKSKCIIIILYDTNHIPNWESYLLTLLINIKCETLCQIRPNSRHWWSLTDGYVTSHASVSDTLSAERPPCWQQYLQKLNLLSDIPSSTQPVGRHCCVFYRAPIASWRHFPYRLPTATPDKSEPWTKPFQYHHRIFCCFVYVTKTRYKLELGTPTSRCK